MVHKPRTGSTPDPWHPSHTLPHPPPPPNRILTARTTRVRQSYVATATALAEAAAAEEEGTAPNTEAHPIFSFLKRWAVRGAGGAGGGGRGGGLRSVRGQVARAV